MYEIWLMLNILWETALGVWPLLAGAVLAWAALVALAWRRGRDAEARTMPAGRAAPPGRAWAPALGASLVVAVLAFLTLPMLTRSSLRELSYWVDWLSVAGIAAGVGLATFAFAWPAARLWRSGATRHA
ncbi:MAG: hypothetical protein JNJ89_19425 [Rubrivivax sp.]|nr:hypothetical protein [Rubrivivax sp.]